MNDDKQPDIAVPDKEVVGFEPYVEHQLGTIFAGLNAVTDKVVEHSRALLPAPVGELDESLLKDIIRQSVDVVSSLDAAIAQNPAAADELRDAKRAYQQGRVYLQLALEADDTWKNKPKEEQ